MRNVRGAAQMPVAGPSHVEGGDGQLYIINLSSANTPMTLEVPDAPELGGFAVFRSRRMEDGRDRFRLHLGYFDSQEQAEKFLPLVRDRYPAAWVALAPREGMGSLDDTNVAQFKFIPHQKGTDKQAQPTAPVQPKAQVQAKASPQPPLQSPASARRPAEARAVPKAAAPSSNETTIPAEQFLHAEDVLSLLESPPRALPAAEPAKEPPKTMPAARTGSTASPSPAVARPQTKATELPAAQSFAVQLIWSAEKPDTAQIPRLAIFDAYTMYTVTVQRAGRVWYGLRLGFFSDPVSARQVSLYVRSDFSAAAVVPVSERECARADEAAKVVLQREAELRERQRARAAPVPRAPAVAQEKAGAKAPPAPTLSLTPDPAPAQAAATQEDFRKAMDLLDQPAQAASKKAARPQPAAKPARARRPSSTEQLMEELGAHTVTLADEDTGAFIDTGVRHLSVAVVKPKRKMGKLLSRISGRR